MHCLEALGERMLKEEKAQISIEFLLIIAGVLFIAAVIGLIIKKTIIVPTVNQITDMGS